MDIVMLMALFGGGIDLGGMISNIFGAFTGSKDTSVPASQPESVETMEALVTNPETEEERAYNERMAAAALAEESQATATEQARAEVADQNNNVGDTLIAVGVGAAGGAAIGSLIFPGPGSVIGAGIGALAGWIGSWFTT